MQGKSDAVNRELMDAAALVGHLVRPGTVYALLAEHRHRLFPDEMFADLVASGRGRPSVPADVIATVMILQQLEGLSDRDAIEALRADLRWKVAGGLRSPAQIFFRMPLMRVHASSRACLFAAFASGCSPARIKPWPAPL